MKRLLRHFRRRGLLWAAFGIRLVIVGFGIAVFNAFLWATPNGWSVVAVIACYGIYAVTGTLKKRQPLTLVEMKSDRLAISGSQFTLNAGDLNRAVERLIEKEKSERGETT